MRSYLAGERGAPWCSFCGKSHKEVEQMVSAPGAWICNECVEHAAEVIARKRAEAARSQPERPQEASHAV